MRADHTTAQQRLADNMLDVNPATTDSLVRLMWGALVPSREGGLVNARLRYFDPIRKRAGLPTNVAALVSSLADRQAIVTLVNTSTTAPHTIVVSAGAYGEHQIDSVSWNGRTQAVNASHVTVQLAPGAGATLTLAMRRYVNRPTVAFPWDRQ